MAVEPQIGRVIAGKYRLEHSLGTGGMGKVVAATHLGLGRKVALKFMRLGVLDNAEAMGRFMREARAAAALRSENVARVMDVEVDTEDGAPYIVMEYLEGRDLGFVLESGAPAVADAVGYVLQACEGLAEAHAHGIVHRDLKPANLFLTRRPDGTPLVKVLDFGVSKLNEAAQSSGSFHLTEPSRALGSPLYMSPEQMVASPHVDQRADIWALGVILYELLSGKPPFDAGTLLELGLAIATQPHPPLVQRVPGLAPGLAAVVDRCLQKKPAARFADLAGLAAALVPYAAPEASASADRIARTLGVRAPAAEVAPPARPWMTPRLLAVAAIAVALVAGVAVFSWRRAPAVSAARGPAAAAPVSPAAVPTPVTPPKPAIATVPQPVPAPAAAPPPAATATATPRKRARRPERAAAAPTPAAPRPPVERPAVEQAPRDGATRTRRGPVVTDL